MNMTETTSHLKERFSDAKEQVKDLGRTAGEKLDEARHWTAGEVQSAASSVRTAGRQGSEAIDGLASTTADKWTPPPTTSVVTMRGACSATCGKS